MTWWAALAPVTLPVDCGDQRHELHWAEGGLTAPGHPDADRERALAALGADPSPCLRILDAWHRHADDLDVFVLASRGPSDPLDQSRLRAADHPNAYTGGYMPLSHAGGAYASMMSIRPTVAKGWTSYRPMGPRRYVDYEDEAPDATLPTLLSLGSGLPLRLTATVIATWAERIEADDERVAAATPALDAALYGRLRTALLPWLGTPTKLDFTLQPSGGKAAMHREANSVRVALPFAWLRDVWATGLAVVLDRFCIEAQQTAPGTWTLTTVDRDLATTRTVTVHG